MLQSIQQFANHHGIPMKLTPEHVQYLQKSRCQFCQKYTKSCKKTYQNVGLRRWKRGFVRDNVFPLCKYCYIMRNGMNKKEFFANVTNICFRIPVKQLLTYGSPVCKKYNETVLCKGLRCAYCHNTTNLSIDKINPNGAYTRKNIQTLCWTCNRMKSNLKESTFFKHVKRIFYKSLKLSTSKWSSSFST